jgi:hypothetical protein
MRAYIHGRGMHTYLNVTYIHAATDDATVMSAHYGGITSTTCIYIVIYTYPYVYIYDYICGLCAFIYAHEQKSAGTARRGGLGHEYLIVTARIAHAFAYHTRRSDDTTATRVGSDATPKPSDPMGKSTGIRGSRRRDGAGVRESTSTARNQQSHRRGAHPLAYGRNTHGAAVFTPTDRPRL